MNTGQIKREFKTLVDEVRRKSPDFANASDEEIIDGLLSQLAEDEPDKIQLVGRNQNGQNIWIRPEST